LGEKTGKNTEANRLSIIFEVPVPRVKEPCTMKEENRQHGRRSEPINV
jgi:hypothetical protein